MAIQQFYTRKKILYPPKQICGYAPADTRHKWIIVPPLPLQIEKGWAVDEMIVEFSARQWKQHTLYFLVRRIDCTDFAVNFVFK